MSEKLTMVRLNFPLFRGSLSLRRVPKYLRFTCRGIGSCSRQWDALDQLDDEPEPGEKLFAAVLASQSSVHLDRTVRGRRVGEWIPTASYDLVPNPPAQEILRDRAQWQQWCVDQEAKSKEKKT